MGMFEELRAGRIAARNANQTGTYEIYQIKKDGTMYRMPHSSYTGQSRWTKDEARAEVLRMSNLNPTRTFVMKEYI